MSQLELEIVAVVMFPSMPAELVGVGVGGGTTHIFSTDLRTVQQHDPLFTKQKQRVNRRSHEQQSKTDSTRPLWYIFVL